MLTIDEFNDRPVRIGRKDMVKKLMRAANTAGEIGTSLQVSSDGEDGTKLKIIADDLLRIAMALCDEMNETVEYRAKGGGDPHDDMIPKEYAPTPKDFLNPPKTIPCDGSPNDVVPDGMGGWKRRGDFDAITYTYGTGTKEARK